MIRGHFNKRHLSAKKRARRASLSQADEQDDFSSSVDRGVQSYKDALSSTGGHIRPGPASAPPLGAPSTKPQ